MAHAVAIPGITQQMLQTGLNHLETLSTEKLAKKDVGLLAALCIVTLQTTVRRDAESGEEQDYIKIKNKALLLHDLAKWVCF